MAYKVKELADLVGVSVRTLHHYDEIGLLKPGEVSAAGYRLYAAQELERLQQILFFREIGFSLQEIKDTLDSPDFDRKRALAAHKEILLQKKQRLEDIIDTVNKTIASIEGGPTMSEKEMFGGFDMKQIQDHKNKYSKEARERYGDEIVEKAEKKADSYSQDDWAKINARQEANMKQILDNMHNGPADPLVQEAIADSRQAITDYYYDCTPEIFRGLGDLYVLDERFTEFYEKIKPGLAEFMRDAMHHYVDNLDTGK
ncbi:DNA-binding transcriptional MerR regulator [Tumebacillus sp. BK434]|uniref:MerR family transcriptional regulator n=1 Tax=Tumebacillus sp. BK434 TaxID=2512169 RepID=UPI0010496F18|nr:MerR family transcriptional regulator [Tumebacillus sp. BK434]TCP52190.1 DNA-binding transcriptional MerR regulator [Tumebacillus sp. BK434]